MNARHVLTGAPAEAREVAERAAHYTVSAGILATVSAFEGVLYLMRRKKERLSATRTRGKAQRLTPERLSARDIGPDTLRPYLAESRPVILTGLDQNLLEHAPRALRARSGDLPEQRLLIDVRILPRLGSLGRWILRHTGRPAVYMARFSGSYGACIAHIDSLPSYNFYVMYRGRKRVIIVPREHNARLDLANGYDSVFVREDQDDFDHLQWLDALPDYYDFELEEGEVLLFHNSACLHKFANLTASPEVYTIRLVAFDAAAQVLRNDVGNWAGAKFFARALAGKTLVRETYSV
ncbi:MAG: hypothetical protein AAGA56_00715 [Myxococcota bacterium]